jgi:hypothetical protein
LDIGVKDDIAALDVSVASGQITLRVTTHDSFVPASTAWFWIDSDRNPATGDICQGLAGGRDYPVTCNNMAPTAACDLTRVDVGGVTGAARWPEQA